MPDEVDEESQGATPPLELDSFLAKNRLTSISKPFAVPTVSLKAKRRSQIAFTLILFSLFWFGMEWEFAGPRRFREISIDRPKESSVIIPPDEYTRPHSNSTRAMVGSWQANTWIPPEDWNYLSVTKMQQLYANKTLLWLGDSLSRRAALTWHSLLRTPDARDASLWSLASTGIIDVTKEDDDFECPLHLNATHRPRICRLNTIYPFLQVREKCWTHVLQFLDDERKNPVIMSSHRPDLMVVATGIWDIDVKMVCRLDDFRPLPRIVKNVIVSLNHVALSGTRVVVRTAAYSDWGPERAAEVDEMNEVIMDSIDQMQNPFLTYIHWGGAMRPRALFPHRIAGDNKAHFGVEGRLVLIHMLTNHLLDVGFFKPVV